MTKPADLLLENYEYLTDIEAHEQAHPEGPQVAHAFTGVELHACEAEPVPLEEHEIGEENLSDSRIQTEEQE